MMSARLELYGIFSHYNPLDGIPLPQRILRGYGISDEHTGGYMIHLGPNSQGIPRSNTLYQGIPRTSFCATNLLVLHSREVVK